MSKSLEDKTVVELKKLAKSRGVSLAGVTRKADIIRVLSKNIKKEKLKKSVQKPTKPSKVSKKKMTSSKDLFVISRNGRGIQTTNLHGPFASKEAALYYIFNEESARLGPSKTLDRKNLATKVISSFVYRNMVGSEILEKEERNYLIVERNDIQAWKDPNVSFAEFKKMITASKAKKNKDQKERKERDALWEAEKFSDELDSSDDE